MLHPAKRNRGLEVLPLKDTIGKPSPVRIAGLNLNVTPVQPVRGNLGHTERGSSAHVTATLILQAMKLHQFRLILLQRLVHLPG